MGDSQIWGKHTPFERALHTPLIVRVPGITRSGTYSDALVESSDIYPTLVDLCQPAFTRTQYPLDGPILRPLLEGRTNSIRDTAVSYWGDAVTVRTLTDRLIFRRTGDKDTHIELYDLRDTPDPVKNIAAEYPDLVSRLLRQ